MSEFLLNCTPVQVKDDEFEHSFDVGYLHCKVNFLGKNVPITDELLYTVIAQIAIDVRRTSRHNIGYLAGFFYALLEKEPRRPRFHIVGKITSLNEMEVQQ